MQTPRQPPSSAELAAELTSLSGGLGILMVPLFPLALPGLLLFLGLAVVCVVVAEAVVLLAIPFVLPVWLTRIVLRSRSRRRSPAVPASDEIRAVAAGQSAATSVSHSP